jgi:hypothetical protein
MKIRLFSVLITLLSTVSCEEKDVSKSDLLSSKVWTNPKIIKGPGTGFSQHNACDMDYKFESDGNYSFSSGNCNEKYLTGSWKWIKKDQEFRLETVFNNIPQRNYIITIVALSDTALHTIEIVENDTTMTYEKVYSVR